MIYNFTKFREMQQLSINSGMPFLSASCWVVLTLICDICRTELHDHSKDIFPESYGFEISLSLCLLELGICVALLDIQFSVWKSVFSEGLVIWIVAQIGGSFLENFWLSLHKTPTLVYSVGYLEPLMTLPLAKCCLDFVPSPITFISLLTLTFGALCFSAHVPNFTSTDRSGVIIGCFVVFYAIRNMCCKSLQDEGINVELRKRVLITSIGLAGLASLLSGAMSSWQLSALIFHFTTDAVLVSLTVYLSLKIMETNGVLFMAILGIWSKVLINLFCVTNFHTPHMFVAVFAVAVMVLGTSTWIGQSHPGHFNKLDLNESFTRMVFLIFVGGTVSVLFYVFQPRVSDRDLQALSYVRLDGIMRKLLQHDRENS